MPRSLKKQGAHGLVVVLAGVYQQRFQAIHPFHRTQNGRDLHKIGPRAGNQQNFQGSSVSFPRCFTSLVSFRLSFKVFDIPLTSAEIRSLRAVFFKSVSIFIASALRR